VKTYCIKANELTEGKDIILNRSDIIDVKRKVQAGGDKAYSMMLNLISSPFAMVRVCMIPGTRTLLLALNSCVITGRLLIVAFVVLLICRMWWFALSAVVLSYIISFQIQTHVNYEIGARLFLLDQRLK